MATAYTVSRLYSEPLIWRPFIWRAAYVLWRLCRDAAYVLARLYSGRLYSGRLYSVAAYAVWPAYTAFSVWQPLIQRRRLDCVAGL
jgi:hypothetical protein